MTTFSPGDRVVITSPRHSYAYCEGQLIRHVVHGRPTHWEGWYLRLLSRPGYCYAAEKSLRKLVSPPAPP